MQGKILTFSKDTNTGLISGYDGIRYNFGQANWVNEKIKPKEGLSVDFDTKDRQAIQIIVLKDNSSLSEKKILPAFILFFFLGFIGGHRFYTGNVGSALFMILLLLLSPLVLPFAFLCLWLFFDFIFLVTGNFTDNNNRKLTEWA